MGFFEVVLLRVSLVCEFENSFCPNPTDSLSLGERKRESGSSDRASERGKFVG
jgi:hypothetical protein